LSSWFKKIKCIILAMQTIKPLEAPQQNFVDIFHRHKGAGESTGAINIYSKYGITREDMKRVANLVEEISGLPVDEKAKRGSCFLL